jgi:putative DNA primase/helicase
MLTGHQGINRKIRHDERPCFRVFDDWLEHDGGSSPASGSASSGKNDALTPTENRVCALHIEAVTFDGQDNNPGGCCADTLGRWREGHADGTATRCRR